MKTITIYELLGMVKDDKELPKKINVLDVIYEFDDHNGDYYNKSLDRYLFVYMTSSEDWKLAFFLDLQVEIIEEKKIPKKLNYQYRNLYGRLSQHKQSEIDIIDTLNGVIDYLKSKGDE